MSLTQYTLSDDIYSYCRIIFHSVIAVFKGLVTNNLKSGIKSMARDLLIGEFKWRVGTYCRVPS